MATVVLAGGGSVGHLAPGFAVRDALRALGHDGVFATPGEAREAAWFPPGEPARLATPSPRRGKGLLGRALLPLRLARAVVGARRVLRAASPGAVLALGGWPCAATAVAASTLGLPLHLLATDAVAGVVVRRLAGRARRIWLADARALDTLPAAARSKATVVGPVVRRDVRAARRDAARFGLDPARRTLLVVGGSLGAQGLNRRARDGLVAALRDDPALAGRVQVIHSTGTDEEAAAARADYRAAGVVADVRAFVPEIGEALVTADLVLCRGGAGTIAEVGTLGRPAVVVPYPHHADRQQFKNAEPLVARGQAVVVEEGALDAPTFRREVLARLLDDAALTRMAAAGRGADREVEGTGDAAATIALGLVRSIEDAGGRR